MNDEYGILEQKVILKEFFVQCIFNSYFQDYENEGS
jgi:hypothetical protein